MYPMNKQRICTHNQLIRLPVRMAHLFQIFFNGKSDVTAVRQKASFVKSTRSCRCNRRQPRDEKFSVEKPSGVSEYVFLLTSFLCGWLLQWLPAMKNGFFMIR
ncbi:hypothetical protein GQX74_014409 [Glossina fuscipes]|nr:hypothetical protein GQX74_014409 [Glossina fuscipes]